MAQSIAIFGLSVISFIFGALVQDLKAMSKQERRQGAFIGLLVLLLMVISGIAH